MNAPRFSTGAMIAIGLCVGCSSEPGILTYDEFKAQAYQEPDTGIYVMNGDELVETEEAMSALYDSYLQSVADAADRADGVATIQQGSIVNRVGGADDKWSASQALNLTYCISSSSFGSRYSAMVSAMDSATGAWEASGTPSTSCTHSRRTRNCTSRNTSVVFNVRQVSDAASTSRARSSRAPRATAARSSSSTSVVRQHLAVDARPASCATSSATRSASATSTRAPRRAPASRTTTGARSPRTTRRSVMHYPQCNGTQNGDLVLTNSDKAGVSALY